MNATHRARYSDFWGYLGSGGERRRRRMWVFEVLYIDLKDMIDGKMQEKKGTQYIVADTLQDVYRKVEAEMSIENREFTGIVRHVPVCHIIERPAEAGQ
jgi:hypothetical protein